MPAPEPRTAINTWVRAAPAELSLANLPLFASSGIRLPTTLPKPKGSRLLAFDRGTGQGFGPQRPPRQRRIAYFSGID
jgi:hypothetical protein